MTRESRIRNTGLLFYLVLLTSLILTDSGSELLCELMTNFDDTSRVGIAIVSLGLAFFTSEPIGYVFNSIYIFLWNVRGGRRPEFGGYAAEWRKLTWDPKTETLKRYEAGATMDGQAQPIKRPEGHWEKYSPDVFLSYFWQQAPKSLVSWVSRRHTVFFMGRSVIVGMGLAMFLSVLFVLGFNMGWTLETIIVLVMTAILMAFIEYNVRGARTEAWEMVDLWIAKTFDRRMRKAVEDVEASCPCDCEGARSTKLTPPFKVMRRGDVKTRKSENEKRLYYFDETVDVVATTISKRHVEPSHLHTSNVETYYVVRGKLLVSAEGQDFWLSEGDLMVVNPGTCHHFETCGEETTFLAIKKEPGLNDKRPC
jgi:quercetin dioxygenase-like cupin family protein